MKMETERKNKNGQSNEPRFNRRGLPTITVIDPDHQTPPMEHTEIRSLSARPPPKEQIQMAP